MKPLGIVRNMDDLGRVVIPKEIRRNIGIKEGDEMEIFATNKGVYFQKYDPNDETTPDIFREMGCAEVPAQPPTKTESRKKVIFRDDRREEDYHLYLTDDQIDLLDWMIDREYILEGSYELIEDTEFITI
jgi:AbrB family looped-hinge helix DNA binding protein